MKRSEINAYIREFEAVLREHCFLLPPFVSFSPEEWETKDSDYDEIRDNALGWDLTDFGSGDFASCGLSLITLRNGNPHHFHWHKMEDIINRGGGNVVFRLWNTGPDELPDRLTPVTLHRDGRICTVPAGSEVIIGPGESLTLHPGCYHEFYPPAR